MTIRMVVINKKSLCIFSKSYDEKISLDPEMIGGFLSAISTFATDLSSDSINSILTGKLKILYGLIDKNYDIQIIVIADKDDKDSNLRYIINQLETSFFKLINIQDIDSTIIDTNSLVPFEKSADNIIQAENQGVVNEVIDESKILLYNENYNIDFKNINLPFLFKTLKKQLGKVIYSLYNGKRIIIAGSPDINKLIIDSLKLFSPNRILKTIYWTTTPDETEFDIIGVPVIISGLFIDSTIVNIEKNSVLGIKSNKYFDDFVKKIKKLNAFQVRKLFDEKINFLNEKIKEFSNLINTENVSTTVLENFAKNIDKDILEILENYLKINNPRSIDRIRKTCDKIKEIFMRQILL